MCNIYHALNVYLISNVIKLYNFIKHKDKKAKQFNFHEYCTLKVQRLCIYYLKPNTRKKTPYNKYSKRIKIARKFLRKLIANNTTRRKQMVSNSYLLLFKKSAFLEVSEKWCPPKKGNGLLVTMAIKVVATFNQHLMYKGYFNSICSYVSPRILKPWNMGTFLNRISSGFFLALLQQLSQVKQSRKLDIYILFKK